MRQIATAVDALEEAGAEPPPLILERVWVDEAGVHLDGLDACAGVALVGAASTSAALAELLQELVPRVGGPLGQVITRARDGAYLSAGQFARELGEVKRRRWRFLSR